eukprot:Nk52_evm9s2640 gene=Nk52_evmTU9s2640
MGVFVILGGKNEEENGVVLCLLKYLDIKTMYNLKLIDYFMEGIKPSLGIFFGQEPIFKGHTEMKDAVFVQLQPSFGISQLSTFFSNFLLQFSSSSGKTKIVIPYISSLLLPHRPTGPINSRLMRSVHRFVQACEHSVLLMDSISDSAIPLPLTFDTRSLDSEFLSELPKPAMQEVEEYEEVITIKLESNSESLLKLVRKTNQRLLSTILSFEV